MAIYFTLGTRVPPNVDNYTQANHDKNWLTNVMISRQFKLQTNPNPNVVCCDLFRSFCCKPKVYSLIWKKVL